MFGSLFELTKDVAGIVAATVSVPIDVARVVTKPVIDLAKDISKEIKALTEDK